jgi:inosine/xanthosine triphosphate pyrophosphatase family protein
LKLLLATHNEHKRRELERLLGSAPGGGWQIEALPGRGDRSGEHRR